uniref:HMG box domain-containing protein n=1 Tax=Meloidogyne enterolobii TaxID=390850 RepID=A0A6V7VQJ3_MELEN|nr:unnamed protein product [Meloidogyne enterolobii]
MATFLKTEYSRKKMIFEGYVYVRNAFSQDKQTKYWICELNERRGEHSCMGRAVTSMRPGSEDFEVTVTQSHSHAPGIERQRSPSTESIRSDRTEPGNVPDTSAFADEMSENKEQQNDKVINEIIEKLNNETDQTIIIDEIKAENITIGPTPDHTINTSIQQPNNSQQLDIPPSLTTEEPPPILEPEIDNISVSVSDTNAQVTSNNISTEPTNFSLQSLNKIKPSTPNGFLLWSIDYKRNNQLGVSRHLGFAEHSELQKILGAKWRTLPDEEKRIWNEKADRIRAAKSAIHKIPILRPKKKKIKAIIIYLNLIDKNIF